MTFSEKNYLEYDPHTVIDQGRAKDYLQIGGRKNYVDHLRIIDNKYITGEFYLDVNGNVVEGCNWSYKNQQNHKKGNVLRDRLSDIIPKEDHG